MVCIKSHINISFECMDQSFSTLCVLTWTSGDNISVVKVYLDANRRTDWSLCNGQYDVCLVC